MSRRSISRLLTNFLVGAGLTASIAGSPVLAADYLVGPGAIVETSVCAHEKVHAVIQKNFRYQVTHVPHLPDVDIAAIYNTSITRHLPATENSPIERLYCQGTAQLSDGSNRSIWYLIEYGQGFASIGDNVEFCVAGFDRWNVYNNWCRVLR